MRVTRRVQTLAAVIVPLVAGVLVASFAVARDAFVPAAEGEPTYSVESVSIESLEVSPAGMLAVVSFTTRWPTQEFPGYVTCRASLIDAAGEASDSFDFQYASFLAEDAARIEMNASTEPLSAEVQCGKAERPSPASGYAISNLRVEKQEMGPPLLVFHAKWLTDEPPLYQDCTADLETPAGTTETYSFGISVGPDQDVNVLLTDEFVDAKPIGIVCRPVEGADNE